MPVPSRERVVELLTGRELMNGFDLEDVTVSRAGAHSVVKVVVDRDEGVELDAAADLSRRISEVLDSLEEFGNAPYNLEVTTPGIDRPLTEPRHWRRSRGRWVALEIADESGEIEKVEGRVGALSGGSESGGSDFVDLVVRSKTGPSVRPVPLASVHSAVVQVEFRTPNREEFELAGGVAPGRFDPLNPPEQPEADFGDEDDEDTDEERDK
ncbi:ribosome maturation factor RimP [Rhodococcoides trifolii]|uniref:Ribosome maturation factor RimP n=1 Tax=Rhodococcoides trifolii TaxID=908250 RepID=A0A917FUY4_9NOCA|nr:ribosome maturation factor RimP [Rhodococcus trifolii]GGG07618.1 ribosome maturation factor RimP [Rhodococcus trifolii]